MGSAAIRRAFDIYLRTGRRISPESIAQADAAYGTKFNPYHDPRNGRFTSGGGGRGDGTWGGGGFTGGGGGSFGGGGASGDWGKSLPAQSRTTRRDQPNLHSGLAIIRKVNTASVRAVSQDRVLVRNAYTYRLDAADRTISVTGTLTLSSVPQRSRSAQTGAGGSDRLPTDDGGHYVAVRFNGPTDTFNHFAQNANFNRGGYRVLEDGWAKEVKRGRQVYVAIVPTYDGSSKRPDRINVTYVVDGARGFRSFPNTVKGKPRGK